jgi:AcrR family transcriptional regulator
MRSKDETYFKILNTVLRLDVQKGHLKWTISDLSRHSGITRSLIYYYFGRQKQQIIEEAISFLTENVFSINKDPKQDLELSARFLRTLAIIKQNPFLYIFFYLRRIQSDENSKQLIQLEENYFKKLKREFPSLSRDQILLIYIIELGIINFGRVDDDFVLWVRDFLKKAFCPA